MLIKESKMSVTNKMGPFFFFYSLRLNADVHQKLLKLTTFMTNVFKIALDTIVTSTDGGC